jgi:hypothetical protein
LHTAVAVEDIHTELVTTVTAEAWDKVLETETVEVLAVAVEQAEIGSTVQVAVAVEQVAQAGWQ